MTFRALWWQAGDGLLDNECESREAGEALLGLGVCILGWLRRVVVLGVHPLHEVAKGRDVDGGPFDTAFLRLLHSAGEEYIQRAGDFGEDRAMDGKFFLFGADHEDENS